MIEPHATGRILNVGRAFARKVAGLRLHEYFIAIVAFVAPLGHTVQPAWLNEHALLIAAVGLATVSIALMLVAGRISGPGPQTSSLTIPLVAYAVVQVVATALRPDLPVVRFQLLGIFLFVVVSFLVVERFGSGRFVFVVAGSAVAHILLALAFRVSDSSYLTNRLTGGISAVGLGFDASMLFLVSFYVAVSFAGWRRVAALVVMVLSLVSVLSTVSRAAILSLAAGVVIAWVSTGTRRLLKLAAVSATGVIVAAVALPQILGFLSQGNINSLLGASGRFGIWSNIISGFTAWPTGYGFGALFDGDGPDAHISQAIGGVPAESAFIQALLTGGVVSLALFLIVVFVVVRGLVVARAEANGVAIAMLVVLGSNLIFSAGAAGQGMGFWWMLAAVSLADRLKPEGPRLNMIPRAWQRWATALFESRRRPEDGRTSPE